MWSWAQHNLVMSCPQVVYDAVVPTSTTTRETLLETALRLLEERGPGALRVRDLAEAVGKSTMGVYTHFGSKQGLLEELYLYGFSRLEARLKSVVSAGNGNRELLQFARAYREFALDNEALYGLMFERATPDFVPSDDSRMAGLATFEMLVTRIAAWRPDLADAAPTAHLVWAAMHGLVSIELTHRRWGGPLVAHLQGDAERNYARAIDSLIAGLDTH